MNKSGMKIIYQLNQAEMNQAIEEWLEKRGKGKTCDIDYSYIPLGTKIDVFGKEHECVEIRAHATVCTTITVLTPPEEGGK